MTRTLLFLAAICLLAQDTTSIRKVGTLQLHRPIGREIANGQTDEFAINVPAGRFVHLVARQMGADVGVKILDPQGKTLLEADRTNGEFGPEAVSFIGEIAGDYRILVSGSQATGRYQIELLESRQPNDADRMRIAAETAEFQAGRETQAGTHEAKLHAIELYNQSATLWQQLHDPYENGLTLSDLANAYEDLGERQKALDYYRQSLAVFHALGDRSGEAIAWNGIAAIDNGLGDRKNALEACAQALQFLQAVGDRSGQARTLNEIAAIHDAGGERQQALDYYGRALALQHALGDRHSEATVLNNIGTVYYALGDRRKGMTYFEQALSIFRAIGERGREGEALANLGQAYDDLGDRQKALDYFNQALPLHRAAGDKSSEANTLNSIGGAYGELGEKQKALAYCAQSLAIYRTLGDRSGEARLLNNIGDIYGQLGEQQKALDHYRQALPMRRAAGDRSGEAVTLNNIGSVYSELGDKPKALEYEGQALQIQTDIGDQSAEAATLQNIGIIHSGLGEKQKAMNYFTQSLSIVRALGDRSQEATALNSIGNIYSDLGEKPKALDYYGQALPLQRAVGDRGDEATTLNNIGDCYQGLGDNRKALDYYSQALPLRRAVGDRSGEAITLSNISSIFEKSQPETAILFAKRAINLLQTLRRDTQGLDESLRKTYENSISKNYRYLANLLVGRQRFGEAEEVLNLLKDRETADFIQRDAVTYHLKSATLLDSEQQALARYEQIVSQIVTEGQAKSLLVAKASREALSAAEEEHAKQLDRDLAAANTVFLRFLDEEEKTFATNSVTAKRVEDVRESEGLQDALQKLGLDVVAIYTLVMPDRYTAILVTSGARKAYSTAIPEADLNRKIFDFRQQLQNPGSDPLPLARELYQIVFPEGLRQDLDAMGAKTIMWSIDGALRYVPIAALYDGSHYLVSRFRNSLITPASLTRLSEASPPVWTGVGFGVSQAEGEFGALPAVPDELHRIFRQSDTGDSPVKGRVRLDPDFTRETFEAAMRQPEKSVVHIATHFDSRPGVAANSHLLLGDGSELSLAEIAAMPRLFSGVDLLTLSACSTAFTNRSEDGREVDSFGTVAQRLGARSVIASLWSVNDEATSRLMETMYRIRQKQPELGKSEALRQAQEEMADGALKPGASDAANRGVHTPAAQSAAHGWTHPYYWAPFILIGNWK